MFTLLDGQVGKHAILKLVLARAIGEEERKKIGIALVEEVEKDLTEFKNLDIMLSTPQIKNNLDHPLYGVFEKLGYQRLVAAMYKKL